MIYRTVIIIIFSCLIQFKINADEINIKSNKLELDKSKNISIFSGKVYAWNEDFKIWSEKIVVEFDENLKKVDNIIATEQVKIIKDQLILHGKKGVYIPSDRKLTMSGDIKVNNDGNIIFCDKLTLDLENSISIMQSNQTSKVEASIILKN